MLLCSKRIDWFSFLLRLEMRLEKLGITLGHW